MKLNLREKYVRNEMITALREVYPGRPFDQCVREATRIVAAARGAIRESAPPAPHVEDLTALSPDELTARIMRVA